MTRGVFRGRFKSERLIYALTRHLRV